MTSFISFQEEMRKVEELMTKEISFKSSKLDDLLDIRLSNLDQKLCPALVLAVGSMAQEKSSRIISLAAVVQYIYLAHHIHGLVTDEEMSDRGRQYPVLVGDFMFGQAFLKICEADLSDYASQFVKVIGTMNEGILLRWRLKNKNISAKQYRVIIGKERGALLALASKLGGELAGLKEPHLRKVEDFGFALAMAWAAWEDSLYYYMVTESLEKAKAIIAELSSNLPVGPLQELYDFFNSEVKLKALQVSVK
jgi:all-trans-nonaprenyl-diphosphate synthase